MLEPLWRDLEARADGGFFLTWTWIGTWLGLLRRPPLLLTARRGERVVGLGLLADARVVRRRVVRVRQWALHETGDAALDSLAVEYNGPLLDRAQPPETWRACLAALAGSPSPMGRWHELRLSGVAPGLLAEAPAPFRVALDKTVPCYGVALDAGPWRAALSANTRQQLARTERRLTAQGPLSLAAPRDAVEREAMFERLVVWHEARWEAKRGGGVFADPRRRAFLRALLAAGAADGSVRLIEARAGEEPFGVLLNFRHRDRVLNYQGGFAYVPGDNRLRPGWATHALAIDEAARTGATLYDFMAGESRYKASLGRVHAELVWGRLQRPGVMLAAERVIERLARSRKT